MWLIVTILGFASAAKLGQNAGHHAIGHAGTPGSTSAGTRPPYKATRMEFTSVPENVFTRDFTINAIITFVGHTCVVRNGVVTLRGSPVGVGQSGDWNVGPGDVPLVTGEQLNFDGGLINGRIDILTPTNTQPLENSLARAGLTLDEFIQQTGAIPLQTRIIDINAGVISINGNLRNVINGVIVILSVELVEPTGTEETQPPVDLATEFVQTVTVTETAVHETETVFEAVTLTKTQTRDEFTTVTSPVYNSIAATVTKIVKQTVTVPEEQVVRSTVAGSIVVNTIPVPSQTVLTVSVRNTNMFVRTVTDEVTNSHTHFVTNYSVSTATVNNPVTSTVIQTITQTRVSTVYNISTVGSTVYTTTTATVTIGTAGTTQTSGPGGYY